MTTRMDPVVARWWQLLDGSQMSAGQGHQGHQKHQMARKDRETWTTNNTIREYGQRDMHGHSHHPSVAWGDTLTTKRVNICWIGLLNPTEFTTCAGSAKDNQLQQFMINLDVDIMNFPEVNVCWH